MVLVGDMELDLDGLSRQLASVMTRLAQAVMADIKTYQAAQEEEEKLETLVKVRCVEASDSILNLIRDMLQHSASGPQTTDSSLVSPCETDVTAPPSEEESPPFTPAAAVGGRRSVRGTARRGRGARAHGVAREAKTKTSETKTRKLKAAEAKTRKTKTAELKTRKTKTAEDKTKTEDGEVAVTKPPRGHYPCPHCSELFRNVLDLRNHALQTHGVAVRPFACDYCEKTFNHKPHRDNHHRMHRGERSFHCETCGKAYTTISQLKTHQVTHEDKSYICDVCGNAFYQLGHLRRHKRVHQPDRPFSCETCGKGFTQVEGLRVHRATHDGERELCTACGKSYRSSYLKQHMMTKHAEELPPEHAPQALRRYTCDVAGCGKSFLYPSVLKQHTKHAHSGKRPGAGRLRGPRSEWPRNDKPRKFVCHVCEAAFNTAGNLTKHSSIHTGETPYCCSACGKRFRLLDFLKTHQKTHLKHNVTETDQALEAVIFL